MGHSDIKFVRTPRMAGKENDGISYAFIEFGGSEECKAAKNKLSTSQFKGNELYVDFVGENSTSKKKNAKVKGGLNPTRLFVCGLAKGIDKRNLKEMFPKAAHADIPQKSKKKGSSYGFVQFSTPADAKAAFDAAQDLTINNHKITVLFAKGDKAKKNKESTGEKRKGADDTSETDVKKAKVEDSEKIVKAEDSKAQLENQGKDVKKKKEKKNKVAKAEKTGKEEPVKKDVEETEENDDGGDDEDDDDDDEDDDDEGGDEEQKDDNSGGDDDDDDDDDEDDDGDDDEQDANGGDKAKKNKESTGEK